MTRVTTLWNPWRDMNRLRREFDQLLNADRRADRWQPVRRQTEFPPINVWDDQKGVVVTAELPGLDASQIDVTVEKDSLTLSAKRAEETPTESDQNYVRRERWFEPFTRAVELPFDVNTDQCDASYEKGVLTVKLQRAPESQPKKLTIKAG